MHNRYVAAIAYEPGKASHVNLAHEYFEKNKRGSFGDGRNYDRTVNRWGKRLYEAGHLGDAPRSGKKPLLDKETLLACANEFLDGILVKDAGGEDVWIGWTSISAAIASGKCADINAAMNATGMHHKAFWKALKRVMPELPSMKCLLDIRPKLSDVVKAKRLAVAKTHRRLPQYVLDQVIWIDAKKLHVAPDRSIRVYRRDEDEMVTEEPRLSQGKSSTGHVLHYYSAVNAKLGVVLFKWVTGTTGLDKRYKTQVSAMQVVFYMGCHGSMCPPGTMYPPQPS
jgi:hypothetical protein